MDYLVQHDTVLLNTLQPGQCFQMLNGNSVYMATTEGYVSLFSGVPIKSEGDVHVIPVESVGTINFRRTVLVK